MHRLDAAVLAEAVSKRAPRTMQTHGGIAGSDLQAPRDLGESRAVNVHAPDDVLVRFRQRLHQRESAGADPIFGSGRFELMLFEKRSLATPLAEKVEC